VPLADALLGAGHEVCVASAPPLVDAINACGLTAVPLGDGSGTLTGPGKVAPRDFAEKFDELTGALPLSAEERRTWDVFRYFMLPPMWDFHPLGASPADPHPVVDDLVAFARHWRPDLILWDPPFVAGSIAARLTGAAHVRLMWTQDYFPFAVRMMERLPGVAWNPFVETVRPAARRHGVDVDEEILLGQATVDAMPTGMRLPDATTTIPMRWVPYTGSTVMPDWLYEDRSRPRIALSLGQSRRLVITEGAWDPVSDLLDLVSDVDAEVVATLNAAQLANVDKIPDNVRTVDYVPLNVLLPTCAGIIHHGAIGTFGAAATFRLPQLIVDSPDYHHIPAFGRAWTAAARTLISANAARYVPSRNAGFTVDMQNAPDESRARLRQILTDPALRDGVSRVHAELMATPSPHDVVPRLVDLARSGGA
jgi:glycosyltransferase